MGDVMDRDKMAPVPFAVDEHLRAELEEASRTEADLLRRQLHRAEAECERLTEALAAPVPMILTCPSCGARHVDEGKFATHPHHTHACQGCGMCWRPSVRHTVGVQFLPGFRNAAE